MKLPISDRLLSCAGFIHRGDRVADIGCDHGYLSIHLLKNGIAVSCIAADVNEGPLRSAMGNARKYGVADKMTFFLSDGAQSIPKDFDVMVCAGMGADTMVHILTCAPWLRSARYRLVLQCQSKTPMLRSYLSDHGWRIAAETVLRDGRFLYTVMEAVYDPEHAALEAGEAYFPAVLLENPSADVSAYYRWVRDGLRIATAHQEDARKTKALSYLEELAAHNPILQEECV